MNKNNFSWFCLDQCSQVKDEGICPGNVPRFYFDKTAERCLLFSYGGCGGNTNNFVTEEGCISTCGGPAGALLHAIQLHGRYIHSVIYSFIHPYFHLFSQKFIQSYILSVILSFCIHTFIYSVVLSFIHSYFHLFSLTFIYSVVLSFIQSYFHLFNHTFI